MRFKVSRFWLDVVSRAAPEAACGAEPKASTERVRMPGVAGPLTPQEALSLWQGGGQGLGPPYLPPQPVRQVRTRDATEGVAQAERGVFVVVLHSHAVGLCVRDRFDAAYD